MIHQVDTRAARQVLRTQLGELKKIEQEIRDGRDVTHGRERLQRWKTHTVTLLRERVHEGEADRLKRKQVKPTGLGDPHEALLEEAEAYEGVLDIIGKEIEGLAESAAGRAEAEHEDEAGDEDEGAEAFVGPDEILDRPALAGGGAEASEDGGGGAVFIVHGHDELNSLRLEKILRERWQLEPIVLSGESGTARTAVDRFEAEGRRAAFAIVMLAPEDEDSGEGEWGADTRPRMLFELGWFYGRLGRDRVCLLSREGARLPGGFDGVPRVEFSASVAETRSALQRAFVEAGVL